MKNTISQVSKIKNPHKNQILKDRIVSLTPCEKGVYDRLLYGFAQHEHNWISQQSIADFVGCTLRTVSSSVRTLQEVGLLTKKRPYRFATCDYYLPDIIKTNPMIDLLKGIFPNLKYFWQASSLCLSLLSSGSEKEFSKRIFRTIGDSYYSELTLSKSLSKEREREHIGAGEKLLRMAEREKEEKEEREIDRLYPSSDKKSRLTGYWPKEKSSLMNLDEMWYEGKCMTVSGSIALSCFPDSVVQKAFSILQKKKGIQTPSAYLISICSRECKDLKLTIDFDKRLALRRELIAMGVVDSPEWRDLTEDEIAAIAKKEKKKPQQREGWSSHFKKTDIITEVLIPKESVEENVKLLEKGGLFKRMTGIDPHIFFAKALIEGEKVERSTKELERREQYIKIPAFQEQQNRSRVDQEKKRDFLPVKEILGLKVEKESMNIHQGSTESEEGRESNGNTCKGSESSVSGHPGK